MKKAIQYFGTQGELAKQIGISQVAVSKWMKNGIPPNRAIQIEQLTNGEITRQELRPDFFN
jgi:DNA-binding transcriptional regulator YdaS (Cro superfamily)